MTRKNPYLKPEEHNPTAEMFQDEQDGTPYAPEWSGGKTMASRPVEAMSDSEWSAVLTLCDTIQAVKDRLPSLERLNDLDEQGGAPSAWSAVLTLCDTIQAVKDRLSSIEYPDDLWEAPVDAVMAECPRCKATEEAAAKAKAEADDIRLRALADLDNAHKRLGREKEEAVRYAAAGVLTDILPTLDNLELALEHSKGNDACKDILVGLEMTRRMLLDALKGHGLEAVGTMGELFDPNIHEAISMTSHPDLPDGAICGLLNRGYRLNERLLRPARVVVCKK